MSLLSLHAPASVAVRENARKGLLKRLYEAMREARMRRAQEVVAQYRHLLPSELETFGNRLDARSEERLPFGR